ncbi:MAG: creatininase family protein [Azospirillaceae bacterium]
MSAGPAAQPLAWQDLTSPDIDALDRDRTVVVLPCGSVEQHGRHMPLGTDTVLAAAVARGAAARLAGRVPVVLLPPPWYGFSSHHMGFPGTVTLRSETYMALVKDIARSVLAHGFRRLALVNGHGGNVSILDVIGADLGHEWHGRARVASVTYFALVADRAGEFRESAPGGMGHAGEFETSLMLHLAADTVRGERGVTHYPDTGTAYLTTDLFGAPRARAWIDFGDLSPTGTFGDPGLASAEKGGRIFEICTRALADFLADFAGWPMRPGGGGATRGEDKGTGR